MVTKKKNLIIKKKSISLNSSTEKKKPKQKKTLTDDTSIKTIDPLEIPHTEKKSSNNVEYVIIKKDEVDRIFQLHQENKWKIANTSYIERIDKIKKFKQSILNNVEDIKEAIYKDFKKSPYEVEISEILPVVQEIKDIINNLKNWMKPKSVSSPLTMFGSQSKIIYEPKGVVLIIGPWNYPFQLIGAPLVAAIAAGNTVIIRPSDDAYHTSLVIEKIIKQTFSDDEVFVFNGDYHLADYLTSKPFDHIFFTGSPNVGKKVMQAASQNLTSVTLELGGKSPVIIDETAPIDYSSLHILWGKILNGGQTCIGVDYVLVHESKYSEFLERAKKVLEQFYGENPGDWKNTSDFCRIINDKNFLRLKKLLDKSLEDGAKIEVGGFLEEGERYISPTILTDVKLNSEIMQEEIFGPILPVIRYKNIEECIAIIQSKWKPLALYIFSNNDNNIQNILANTSSGAFVVNGVLVHLTNPNLPFGGVNHSGHGSYHGIFGFKTFSHERAFLKMNKINILYKLFPPYSSFTSKLVHLVQKYL
jgi:aldehyde dehydrogenase (NAD+)